MKFINSVSETNKNKILIKFRFLQFTLNQVLVSIQCLKNLIRHLQNEFFGYFQYKIFISKKSIAEALV